MVKQIVYFSKFGILQNQMRGRITISHDYIAVWEEPIDLSNARWSQIYWDANNIGFHLVKFSNHPAASSFIGSVKGGLADKSNAYSYYWFQKESSSV